VDIFSSDCKAAGDQLASFASESLQKLEDLSPGREYADLEIVIKDTAAVMYLGKRHHFRHLYSSSDLGCLVAGTETVRLRRSSMLVLSNLSVIAVSCQPCHIHPRNGVASWHSKKSEGRCRRCHYGGDTSFFWRWAIFAIYICYCVGGPQVETSNTNRYTKWIYRDGGLSWCTGIPHSIEVEDIYKGHRIPAGSTVLANTWAIAMNEVRLGILTHGVSV
jgi:hypothetical protein